MFASIRGLAATCLIACCAMPGISLADYPERPVSLVVNFPAGGPLDLMARMVAEKASKNLGQPVVVENKAGASGNIGAEQVVRARPDGYTLLMTIDTVATVNPDAYRNMRFDPAKDLAPIGISGLFTQVLVTHPDLNTPTFKDFLELASKQDVFYGSAGLGSPGHLPFELLKERTGIRATHIAYKGNTPALTDLLGGQVKVGFLAVPTALPHIRSGKLVALMSPGSVRDPALPEVPTAAELGIDDFEVEFGFVLMAPAGTPEEIRKVWEKQLAEAFGDPEFRKALDPMAVRPVATNGVQAAEWLAAARQRWGDLIRKRGIQLD